MSLSVEDDLFDIAVAAQVVEELGLAATNNNIVTNLKIRGFSVSRALHALHAGRRNRVLVKKRVGDRLHLYSVDQALVSVLPIPPERSFSTDRVARNQIIQLLARRIVKIVENSPGGTVHEKLVDKEVRREEPHLSDDDLAIAKKIAVTQGFLKVREGKSNVFQRTLKEVTRMSSGEKTVWLDMADHILDAVGNLQVKDEFQERGGIPKKAILKEAGLADARIYDLNNAFRIAKDKGLKTDGAGPRMVYLTKKKSGGSPTPPPPPAPGITTTPGTEEDNPYVEVVGSRELIKIETAEVEGVVVTTVTGPVGTTVVADPKGLPLRARVNMVIPEKIED